jgi:hypothetical protein
MRLEKPECRSEQNRGAEANRNAQQQHRQMGDRQYHHLCITSRARS